MFRQKKIKVLQCIRQGQIGGGESHLLSLTENLDKSIFEPIVLSFTDGPMIDRLKDMNIENHVMYSEKPFDFSKWKSIRSLLKERQIQVIHAHGTRANSNILWAAKSLKIPVIYTIHGWSFHQDQNIVVRTIRIMAEKFLTANSSRNISVSSSNLQSGKKYIKSLNSTVINNGIDVSRFNPGKKFEDIRQKLNISREAIVVIFIARFSVQKQPLTLIKAFARIQASVPDLHLLMVGDGDQKVEVDQLINTLGISPKVTLLPFRQDVPDLLSAADIFVLPSLWEGLPIGLLEAMSMGKAIIATRVDGTKEIVKHRVNGFLIETNGLEENLAAALTELGHDKKMIERIGREAIKSVHQKYNAQSMTRSVENIYTELSSIHTLNPTIMEFTRAADKKRLKFIINVLNERLPKDAVVLDVGCGNGVISRSLGAEGFWVKGIDVSEKTINKAKSLNSNPKVNFEVMGAEKLVATGQKYHAVICSEVLEHLSDPAKLLTVLHDILHDDGILLVTVPNGRGPRELLVTRPVIFLEQKNNWAWRAVKKMKSVFSYSGTTAQSDAEDLRHIQFFNLKSLRILASENKFDIIRFGKTNFIEDVFPFSLVTKKITRLQTLDCMVAEKLPIQLTGGLLSIWQKSGKI